MGTDLHARTLAIIEAIRGLPPLPNEPRFAEAVDRINQACHQYMLAYETERDAVRQRYLRSKLRRKDLGWRIIEMAGGGMGVRQIARVLHVAPSTVSRTINRRRPQ